MARVGKDRRLHGKASILRDALEVVRIFTGDATNRVVVMGN